jgi:predicted Zn-dependent protease
VRRSTVTALVEALQPHLPIELHVSDQWIVDERHRLEWDEDLYHAEILLGRLEEITPSDVYVLGVTDQAMYEGSHWWLYGSSRFGGRVAIVSSAHLWVDDVVGETGHRLFRERLSKAALHELAHNLGFAHCTAPRCLMYFATELDTVDARCHTFCNTCLRQY